MTETVVCVGCVTDTVKREMPSREQIEKIDFWEVFGSFPPAEDFEELIEWAEEGAFASGTCDVEIDDSVQVGDKVVCPRCERELTVEGEEGPGYLTDLKNESLEERYGLDLP